MAVACIRMSNREYNTLILLAIQLDRVSLYGHTLCYRVLDTEALQVWPHLLDMMTFTRHDRLRRN